MVQILFVSSEVVHLPSWQTDETRDDQATKHIKIMGGPMGHSKLLTAVKLASIGYSLIHVVIR